MADTKNSTPERPRNFIEEIIEKNINENLNNGEVITRFPPEPNGYLHIGHAKSICLNFGLAKKYKGKTNLRFDDTNPVKEEMEYVESIIADVKWLGFHWEGEPKYASDYFDQLYTWAVKMVKDGKAYVDEQTAEQIAEQKGTPTIPGKESPFRNRPVEESLDLLKRMKNGEFPDGSMLLRAKIDMSSPNMHMRDPIMYRIKHAHHHRTGDNWCIYPMYDWAHGQSDYIEGITHSICTLEFEVHRPLYEWFLEQVYTGGNRPRQIEFARLDLSYTIMSKRKLLRLVQEGYVNGWSDPRMPTISGLRRRGYTPGSIRVFAEKVGVAKRNNLIDVALLEHCVRDDLNKKAFRVLAVLNPLKVTIENYPDDLVEEMDAVNNPEDESMGKRKVPFSKTLYIEKDDFMEDPPRKFFRLAPGREVRLRYGYFITCKEAIKDKNGEITELICTYDPETRGGNAPDGRKVKSTIHWVSAPHAVEAEVRLYDRLFNVPEPDEVTEGQDFTQHINPDSLKIIPGYIEPYIKNAKILTHYQFERLGYFTVDPDSETGRIIFNRTVTLRDNWAKMVKNPN
ncbi:MAG: glutamine--tRNA ligase/YqeY domain fusion protein [Bacteroidota bacterium]